MYGPRRAGGPETVDTWRAQRLQGPWHVLRWLVRAGHLDASAAVDMADWVQGGGFSRDASVRIEAPDRAGLERLLRYCARPPLALDRLQQLHADQLD